MWSSDWDDFDDDGPLLACEACVKEFLQAVPAELEIGDDD